MERAPRPGPAAPDLFDLESHIPYRRAKNLTVRVPPAMRQKLELIAAEKHWKLSQMINRMIQNYVFEYDQLPKAKQTKFDFVS